MTTVIKIDGEEVTPTSQDVWLGELQLYRSGVSTLTLTRMRTLPVVPESPPTSPPARPDPLLNHEVQIEVDDAGLVFTGDILDEDVQWTELGWVTTYQARCLRNRGDWVRLVDDNTKTATAAYNRPATDILYFPVRAGKTIGEVIEDVLTMQENAEALDALGIGGYTSLSPPTLPAETLADLAALDKQPPQVLAVMGNKLLTAIDSFLESTAVNSGMHVRADGVIRFLDLRDCTEQTLTLGDCDDRAGLPSIRRSVADCWSAYQIEGLPRTEAKVVSLSNGGLEKYYAYDSLTTSQAEDAFRPDDYLRGNRSIGTCTVGDTLHVTIDPTDPAQAWASNAWAQGGWGGMVSLTVDVIDGVVSTVTRRVVANTSLSAGGTCVLTLDEALPATDYTRFELYGRNVGPALVYRRYRVVDDEIRAALARRFSVDAVWTWADGRAATTTLFPMASVVWSDTGGPPYSESTDEFTIDGDGIITFARPTYNTAGGKAPEDVKVLLAVTTGYLVARAPASGHEGTANALYGVERVYRHYMESWTDPGNQGPQEDYAQELLDSVKDVAVDVSIDVHKLWAPAFDFENGLSIDAVGYDTGLESANLPIRAATLRWNSAAASHHTTTVHASNRRGALQPENFLPPERPRGGFTWGSGDSVLSPQGPRGGRR